jgi:uncharacterized OsmC-like protein
MFKGGIPLNMIRFPMSFEVAASSKAGSSSLWKGEAEGLIPIVCAIPTEFMGPGGGYSPEDLFALSLLNCLIATFKVYAEKSKIDFAEIKGKIQLTVDRLSGQNGFALTQANIFIDITGASDAERARKVLDAAIKDCAVSNSIKTGKAFHINISS